MSENKSFDMNGKSEAVEVHQNGVKRTANSLGGTVSEPTHSTQTTEESFMDRDVQLPVDVPGMPETVTPRGTLGTIQDILESGWKVFQRKKGIYNGEVAQATWWRFWLLAGTAGFLTSFVTMLAVRPGMLGFVIGLMVGTVIFAIQVAIVLYVAYAFLRRRSDTGASQAEHMYGVGLPYIMAIMISTIVGLVFSFILLPIGGLIQFFVVIYGLMLAMTGMGLVHRVDEPTRLLTAVIMFITHIITGPIALGLVLSFAS